MKDTMRSPDIINLCGRHYNITRARVEGLDPIIQRSCLNWNLPFGHYNLYCTDDYGLFTQGLSSTGPGVKQNWLTWYYVEVFTQQLELYFYLCPLFGIKSIPIPVLVQLKLSVMKPYGHFAWECCLEWVCKWCNLSIQWIFKTCSQF